MMTKLERGTLELSVARTSHPPIGDVHSPTEREVRNVEDKYRERQEDRRREDVCRSNGPPI